MKKLYFLVVAGLFLFNLANICLAQEETKVLTTYYPSPLGVYNNLKLYPHQTPPVCSNAYPENEGVVYYSNDTRNGLYICTDSTGTLEWQLVGSLINDWWTTDPTNSFLYPIAPIICTPGPCPDLHVGIGTLNPLTKLHVDNGAMLVNCQEVSPSDCPGATPVSGAGTRLMFIPKKAAFRAGGVDGTQWNDANIGEYSFAANYNTIASGQASEAFGEGTIASGNSSIAFGKNTIAAGDYSLAAGIGSRAILAGAMAVGISEDPSQYYSYGGITMGKNNFAGYHSWAVGNQVIAGDTSYGHSIAWGYKANARWQYNMAVGLNGSDCLTRFDPYQVKICGDLAVDDTFGVGGISPSDPGNIIAKNVGDPLDPPIWEITTGSKFRIAHPDPNKPAGTFLKHSSIEAPTAGDNLYRWTVEVIDGEAKIQLPDYYKFLNKNDMVWIAPVDNFGRGSGEVDESQNILTVKADLDGKYNVVLLGTRKDEAATKYWQGPEEYIEPEK